jgi:hypothetical protein
MQGELKRKWVWNYIVHPETSIWKIDLDNITQTFGRCIVEDWARQSLWVGGKKFI